MSEDTTTAAPNILISAIPDVRERAAETIRRIFLSIARDKNSPASISQVVELVRDLAGKANKVQVDELAEVIGRDLATTERVIRASNSIGNNPMGTTVKTLPHAILVIGFQQVKNLALSLLLFNKAETAHKNEDCREIASIALAGAVLSKQMMEQFGTQDPEQAFVCASLRSYGELLMASFLPEEYKLAKIAKESMPSNAAFRKIFGLTGLELGAAILSQANLPKGILESIQEIPADRTTFEPSNADDELAFISEYSTKLCETIAEHKGKPAELKSLVRSLAVRYGNLPVEWKHVQDLMSGVDDYLTMIRKVHGSSAVTSPLISKIKALVLHNKDVETTPAAPVLLDGADGFDVLSECLVQMEQYLEEDPVDLHKIYHTGARALHVGLGLEHCVLFSRNKGELDFHARIGTGVVFEAFRNLPPVKVDPEEVFGISINKGDDLMLENASVDPDTLRSFPKWMRPFVTGKPAIVLLIRESEKVMGLFLGVGSSRTIPILREHAGTIRSITRHISFGRRMAGNDSIQSSAAIKLDIR